MRGVVVTRGSGDPVPGALTVLLDAGGRRVAMGLAGADGHFELQAPGPGRYRLAAERIGYATSYSEFFDVEAGQTVERTVVASVQAVSLGAIKVTVGSRCRRTRNAPADVQILWEEARKVLTAVSLVGSAPHVRFRTMRWERDLDPETGTVHDATRKQVWTMGQQPFTSPPAAGLVENGFVQGSVTDTLTYYAPTPRVLLSDAFLSDYCFRAVAGDSGRVGLAFQPVPGGPKVPGVKGTLWLDAASGELRRLQYGYVNLPFRAYRASPGGELDMKRLANGAWIVSFWTIHMPRFARVRGLLTTNVAYVHESGGRVLEVHGLNEVAWGLDEMQGMNAPTGTLRGRLVTGSGLPIPGALVYLSGTSYADTTDSRGAFGMTDVLAGRYELAWSDPTLDPKARHMKPREVDVKGGETEVEIRVACMDSAITGGCPPGGGPGEGVIAGVVQEKGTGVPLGGVHVQAAGASGGTVRTTSDEGGRFRFCWLSAGMYTLKASISGFGAATDSAAVEGESITRRRLGLAVAAVAARGRGASPRLSGQVVDAGTGEPLTGVTVHLQGTKQARVSDDDGRFTFDDVPAGPVVLQATRPGYADASGSVTARPGQSLRLEIRMSTKPIELEPIVVKAVQARRAGLLADVEYRMKHNIGGEFVTRKEIQLRNPRSIMDMIPITARVRWETLQCQPALYLDGVPVNTLADISPTEVEVMEVYRGAADVPGAFMGGTAGCGVVAIWTRRGLGMPLDTAQTRPGGGP
ncbi:MAG: carboxypeptidase regulatory-like domain-containing protein [Syntrophobacterales bacterium]